MEILTVAELQAQLEEVLERVVTDRAAVLVTRGDGDAVVLVSLADYEAGQATPHLVASPANAQRHKAAIAELTAGEAGDASAASDDGLSSPPKT
jgi:antitoxin YefM